MDMQFWSRALKNRPRYQQVHTLQASYKFCFPCLRWTSKCNCEADGEAEHVFANVITVRADIVQTESFYLKNIALKKLDSFFKILVKLLMVMMKPGLLSSERWMLKWLTAEMSAACSSSTTKKQGKQEESGAILSSSSVNLKQLLLLWNVRWIHQCLQIFKLHVSQMYHYWYMQQKKRSKSSHIYLSIVSFIHFKTTKVLHRQIANNIKIYAHKTWQSK